MANTNPQTFFDTDHTPKSIEAKVLRRVPTRLAGSLAVGGTIAAGESAEEVINTQGATRARVRFLTSGTGVPKLSLIPIQADGSSEAGTDVVTSTPGAATEGAADFDLYGEQRLKVKLEETGSSNPLTITRVDVYIL